MTIGTRRIGDFCWINMLTRQPAAAREFFGAVLGWSFTEMPGMGHSLQVGGRDIGAMFDLEGPNTPPGTLPIIGVMIRVANADATVERVKALGGKAQPAFDIADRGRMAVCHDTEGAEFDVWEAKKSTLTDADSRLHGAPTWFETLTTDADRATRFYAALFGWTIETMPMPSGAYTMFKLAGDPIAGAMNGAAGSKPSWLTTFAVNDADAAVREAARLGGTVTVAPHDIPGTGRSSVLVSPQGITFGVIQFKG